MFLNCNQNLSNPECRFIAVNWDVTKLEPDWSVTFIKIIVIIELIAMSIGLILSTLSIKVFIKISSVHLNFSRIVITFTSNFYILVISRLLLLLFETGHLDMEENYSLLVVASIAHIHETGCSINYFFGLIVERHFATIFIADYELHKRAYISTVILIVFTSECLISSIAFSINNINNILETIMSSSAILLALVLGGVLISVYIYRKNKSYYENAQKRLASSLSCKFQLAENFRVFRALIYIAITFGIAAITGSIVLQLSFYYFSKNNNNLSSMFAALFNLQHTIAMVVLNATFVMSLPSWRNDFQLILSRWIPFIPPPTSLVRSVKQDRDVGDHYFNDLIGSWDNRLVNKRQ